MDALHAFLYVVAALAAVVVGVFVLAVLVYVVGYAWQRACVDSMIAKLRKTTRAKERRRDEEAR